VTTAITDPLGPAGVLGFPAAHRLVG
jgi:hypothetical protein